MKNLLHSYSSKLNQGGTIQIVVDSDTDFEKIISLIPDHNYKILESTNRIMSNVGSSDKPVDMPPQMKVITIQSIDQNNTN